MTTDTSENYRRCVITSLPDNEIYVVCGSKVNSRNNESTNTISFWANFSIYEYVTNTLLNDLSNLIFLGCDGTVVNTGVFNGVICKLELKLHRPIQWIICLLHFNELPLRHLFECKSSGPSSYAGDIGRNLKRCEKLPLVAFNSIKCELPGIDPTNLSCDQKYLLDICTSISSGVGSSDMVKCQKGSLNLAHWLTTGNRILRLYITTSNPSNELITFVVFILRVYAPSWFRIKVHHSIKEGARHLWHFISLSRYLPKKYHDIIEPVISHNAYFEAPENMLLVMLTDGRCHIRTLAVRRIIKASEIGPDGNCVGTFIIPAVNFRATDYVDLIVWQACNDTPPIILRHISCHELLKMIQDNVPVDGWNFIKFPSHMQAVQRIVKLVTETSRKRVGPQYKDGFIRATLESIKQMPQFESKKDYKK
ncbi:hypothetical protein AVEN_133688-1 [Araneus ventricosus]|uniref:DUF659 domain-containing protein n=1 Tax=Araneus ventricosus TaxID=182803 RepID=A0A4Y2B737_ARAVE|nr:hypothetical protein AVEN_133688-1 [Araneus ventricosus]